MQICPVGADYSMKTDEQTDGHTQIDMTQRIVTFRKLTNAPTNILYSHHDF
jgi:hypothetical protein